ncbi:uncharacterized protein LOC144581694 [Callithrix jacchus]
MAGGKAASLGLRDRAPRAGQRPEPRLAPAATDPLRSRPAASARRGRGVGPGAGPGRRRRRTAAPAGGAEAGRLEAPPTLSRGAARLRAGVEAEAADGRARGGGGGVRAANEGGRRGRGGGRGFVPPGPGRVALSGAWAAGPPLAPPARGRAQVPSPGGARRRRLLCCARRPRLSAPAAGVSRGTRRARALRSGLGAWMTPGPEPPRSVPLSGRLPRTRRGPAWWRRAVVRWRESRSGKRGLGASREEPGRGRPDLPGDPRRGLGRTPKPLFLRGLEGKVAGVSGAHPALGAHAPPPHSSGERSSSVGARSRSPVPTQPVLKQIQILKSPWVWTVHQ